MITKLPLTNQILRLSVGIIFLFSGLIKLNDPVGFALTIEAYIRSFAINFSVLSLKFLPYTLVIAITVCVIEVILGMALLLKFQTKFIIRVLFLLTGFFALLTLYTLRFSQIDSCGCLSNAIPLTPRQSFIKNIFLLLMLHWLNRTMPHIKNRSYSSISLLWLCLVGSCSIAVGWYTAHKLPIIDFGYYRVGSNIPMLIQNSNLSNYEESPYNLFEPNRNNSTNRSRLHNFIMWDEEREITQKVIQGTKLLCIIQQPLKLRAEDKRVLEEFAARLLNPIEILWLLPLHEEKESLFSSMSTTNHIAWGSMGLLQSMMSTRIGFILLQNGVVMGKWSYSDLPKAKKYLTKLKLYE